MFAVEAHKANENYKTLQNYAKLREKNVYDHANEKT